MGYKNKLSYLYLSLLSQSFTILTTNKYCSSELASHNKRLRLLTATLIIKRLWGNNKNAMLSNKRIPGVNLFLSKEGNQICLRIFLINGEILFRDIDRFYYHFSNIIWMYNLSKNVWNFPKGHKSNLFY